MLCTGIETVKITVQFKPIGFSKEAYVTDYHLMYGNSMKSNEKYNLVYLHHQWSDEAHTLQFCSTGEYSETVEYEPQTPTHVRDIV